MNYKKIIANKQLVNQLGVELFHELVSMHQSSMNGKMKPLQPFPKPLNHTISDYKHIYDKMEYSDVIFKVRDEYIHAHRAILAAKSLEFRELLAQTNTGVRPQSVVLPGVKQRDGTPGQVISPEAFRTFLRYVYYLEKNMEADVAIELIPFANDWGFERLQSFCEDVVMENINHKTALPVLKLTHMFQMKRRKSSFQLGRELQTKCKDYIVDNFFEIDLSSITADIAVDLILSYQQVGWWAWLKNVVVPPCLPTDQEEMNLEISEKSLEDLTTEEYSMDEVSDVVDDEPVS